VKAKKVDFKSKEWKSWLPEAGKGRGKRRMGELVNRTKLQLDGGIRSSGI
jgi:hypothetical protein